MADESDAALFTEMADESDAALFIRITPFKDTLTLCPSGLTQIAAGIRSRLELDLSVS